MVQYCHCSYILFCFKLLGLSIAAFQQSSSSVVTVTRGNRVVLNCSIDISKLKRYSLYWYIYNKNGHQVEKLHCSQDSSTHCHFTNFPLVIEKAKIADNGVYNCSITRTLPPPTKIFFGPLIQICVQGKIMGPICVKGVINLRGCCQLLPPALSVIVIFPQTREKAHFVCWFSWEET